MSIDLIHNITPLSFTSDGKIVPIIAGPCSAETLEQTLTTAHQLKEIGIRVFRAGLWKPRTLPGAFEGVGSIGLSWLQQVKKETGMLIATEVATPNHVLSAINAGVDILWIGARTCTNPFAVQEIAEALNGHDEITMLVKNPVNPDIDLWIGALQRITNAGITKLGAIHRGFSAYGNHIYRNIPEWQLPIELHRRIPTLPIFCDPSHMGGKRELILPISQQALDMGFDGLFIESHCNPLGALSDSAQQITPKDLSAIIKALVVRRERCSTEDLDLLRRQIDLCDDELVELLNKRMTISRDIGIFKKEHKMQVVQTGRYDNIIKKRTAQAKELGMSTSFMQDIMAAIHEESVRQQIEIMSKK